MAGYSIERRSFLSGPITNTARHVKGRPSLSFSRGSSIPNCTARSLLSSAIIGYGNPSPECFAKLLISCNDFLVRIVLHFQNVNYWNNVLKIQNYSWLALEFCNTALTATDYKYSQKFQFRLSEQFSGDTDPSPVQWHSTEINSNSTVLEGDDASVFRVKVTMRIVTRKVAGYWPLVGRGIGKLPGPTGTHWILLKTQLFKNHYRKKSVKTGWRSEWDG